MYENINGKSCFRRLNATHQIGCSSGYGGSIGALHLIRHLEDFNFILNNPPAPPYAPIIYPYLFKPEHILPLNESPYISALIIIDNRTNVESFSHELNCPNPKSGIKSDESCNPSDKPNTWNPYGTGMLYENFKFPIYYVSELEEIEKILQCYEKFNDFDFDGQHKRPLCSIQINSFMMAAVNSEICSRRITGVLHVTKFCYPLSGTNIYSYLYPRKEINDVENRKIDENERFILISTHVDTSTVFDQIGIGAMSMTVPMATLLFTERLLKQILPKNLNKLNVIFMLFDGEAFDYIGSQRIVYDMKKGDFPFETPLTNPINLTNIDLMIDIGSLDDPSQFQVYHVDESKKSNHVISLLNKYNNNFNLNKTFTSKRTFNLPPTSAQTFLREDINFPVVIINSKPLNRFYHSIYDDDSNIKFVYQNTTEDWMEFDDLTKSSEIFNTNTIQMKIRNISSILAFTLYELITNEEYKGNTGTNPVLVDEFLYCFLKSSKCSLFKAMSKPEINFEFGEDEPQNFYISVRRGTPHPSSLWVILSLDYLTSEKVDVPKENCTELPLHYFNGYNGSGECFNSTRHYSDALSPAFINDEYDLSGKYSTWTESVWLGISAQMFLRPSRTHEAVTFSIGIIILVISFILVFCINSKSDILFGLTTSSSNSDSSTANIEPARC